MRRKLTIALPLLVFLFLVFFFWLGLHHDPHHLPSALLNKPAPVFSAQTLDHKTITEQQFQRRITLLNVWSSDCYPCLAEHKLLMTIKDPNVQLIGINYKDDPQQAKRLLSQMGNPYSKVIYDPNGRVAMNFGVYGTPETFIIDKKGIIRYRHAGAITQAIWQDQLLPIIKHEQTV